MRTPKNESLPFNIYKKTKIFVLNLEFLEIPLYKKKAPDRYGGYFNRIIPKETFV